MSFQFRHDTPASHRPATRDELNRVFVLVLQDPIIPEKEKQHLKEWLADPKLMQTLLTSAVGVKLVDILRNYENLSDARKAVAIASGLSVGAVAYTLLRKVIARTPQAKTFSLGQPYAPKPRSH